MPESVTMPQLGESVAEGTIGKWLKRPGDRVERDELLVEVITDKVNADVPSTVAGILEQIVAAEGETVPVGAVIAVIGDGSRLAQQPAELGAEAAAATPSVSDSGEAPAQESASDADHAPSPTSKESPSSSTAGLLDTPTQEGPRFYTPVVLRMAREHGIDLTQLQGSGLGGRVTKRDVERFIELQPPTSAALAPPSRPADVAPDAAPAPAPRSALPVRGPEPTPAAVGSDDEHLPVSPIRRAIAEHMVRSVQTSPHAWSMVEVDMTEVGRLRTTLQPEWTAREGFELTYLPFVLKAVAESLREHPSLNATWSVDHVVLKRRIHLGIAVATDDALIVPVIKDADQLSLVGLARALRSVVLKARAGKLSVDEVRGGTFTVNNTGSLGSVLSQPIINQPQAAILTTEAVVKRPVVLPGDAIAVRAMMNLCCSFDHRVVDGAQTLRFLNAVKRRLEGYSSQSALD